MIKVQLLEVAFQHVSRRIVVSEPLNVIIVRCPNHVTEASLRSTDQRPPVSHGCQQWCTNNISRCVHFAQGSGSVTCTSGTADRACWVTFGPGCQKSTDSPVWWFNDRYFNTPPTWLAWTAVWPLPFLWQAAMWRMRATTWECVPRGTPCPKRCPRDTGASEPLQLPGNFHIYLRQWRICWPFGL